MTLHPRLNEKGLPQEIHHPHIPSSQTARVDLDIHLDAQEAACLKLGFIPRMMEQKWFDYFQDGILYDGFCISKVHFCPEGDGLRATHAEVNRLRGQYENTDDREDARLITERVLQLAEKHLSLADVLGIECAVVGQ